jgi:tetratricopeptide (TPR) repeat protein
LSTPVLFYKGTALSLMKKFTDAMNVLDEYLDGTHNRYRCWSIAARILRADVYKHMNNHDKAVLELRSAAEDYFDDPVEMQRAWFELGFLYHQTGKKGPAKKTLGTALESFPNHKEAARAKRILKELGDEKVD